MTSHFTLVLLLACCALANAKQYFDYSDITDDIPESARACYGEAYADMDEWQSNNGNRKEKIWICHGTASSNERAAYQLIEVAPSAINGHILNDKHNNRQNKRADVWPGGKGYANRPGSTLVKEIDLGCSCGPMVNGVEDTSVCDFHDEPGSRATVKIGSADSEQECAMLALAAEPNAIAVEFDTSSNGTNWCKVVLQGGDDTLNVSADVGPLESSVRVCYFPEPYDFCWEEAEYCVGGTFTCDPETFETTCTGGEQVEDDDTAEDDDVDPDAEYCHSYCDNLGWCCNDHTVGSNQYLSCAQACMIRRRGSTHSECESAVNAQTASRGCARTVNGFTYSMCSHCADLDGTCPHGVQDGSSAGLNGCNVNVDPDAEYCHSYCDNLGWCCRDHTVGSNQYLSCAQACMIRRRGSTQSECESAVNAQTANRGCARTVNGFTYSMCSSCADLDGTCPHGVQDGSSAGLNGCNVPGYYNKKIAPWICANEGQNCKCTGVVYYGQRYDSSGSTTTFEQMLEDSRKKSVSGSITCNIPSFGGIDPARYKHKHCYCVTYFI